MKCNEKITIKALDDALMRLKNHSKFAVESEVKKQNNNQNITERNLTIRAFDKLVRDGYAYCEIETKDNLTTKTYRLTFEGLLILENTPQIKYRNKPYIYDRAINKYKKTASIAKNAIIVANAILIVYFSWITTSFNQSNKEKSTRIELIEFNIVEIVKENNKLKEEINSLKNHKHEHKK